MSIVKNVEVGTADSEATEFHEIDKLDVVQIPTNLPNQRRDDHDVVYKNERAKWKAVIEEIVGCHEKGQPTLIGTVSVERSEVLASMLKKRNITQTVLNLPTPWRESTPPRSPSSPITAPSVPAHHQNRNFNSRTRRVK